MRSAVIGAGAMGSLAALLLHDAGMEVTVYERREERRAELKAKGIRMRGDLQGEAFPEVGVAGEAAPPFDVIILAVSARESGNALRPISPFVHRDTVYVSMQDGNAVSALAALAGEERTCAILSWASACESTEGEVEVEELRSLVLGSFGPGTEAVTGSLAEAFSAACPGKVALTGDLKGEIWRRLEAAAAVSGLCAVAGAVPQEARSWEGISAMCEEAAGECRKTASSEGREYGTPSSPWEDAVWKGVKPPMLRDIEAGRKTEAAFLSGYVVQRARSADVDVPVHSAVLSLIREMESCMRIPGEATLKELARRIEEERGMSLL